jgi:hypothetical protein
MLISPDRRLIISNLGWADKGALWTYDTVNDRVDLLPVGDAKYLSLFPCLDPTQFALLHHYDGRTIRLTVHSFEHPAAPLCSIERIASLSWVQGDVTVLKNAPHYYVAYFDTSQGADYHLLRIDPGARAIQAERFDWFDSSYDKAYQGIVGVTELLSGNLIVSVQRDSHPVEYDPIRKQVIRKLSLADKAGNPTLRLSASGDQIWADDYDTILKLDSHSLEVLGSRCLQMSPTGAAQFIGRWILDEEQSLCIVPRPFSSDVVAISMDTLKTIYVGALSKQPLEAISLKDGRLIARDWKSGELLKGALQRRTFNWP